MLRIEKLKPWKEHDYTLKSWLKTKLEAVSDFNAGLENQNIKDRPQQ